ncbi:MAG: Omp28-related outer membrane protein [Bacteroidetes bacterium]|nr:Omp28-related outer membrane protein [Bacteroidota bacterium]
MKLHIFQLFLLFTLLAFSWSACDKIDEPLKVITTQEIPDDLADTLFYVDSIFVDQKQVLLEEFTGHKCVNCPEQSIAAHELAEENDHRLIIYSIHAGFYAEVDETGDYTTDHRCQDGIKIFQDFQEPFNPTATIDRVAYSGSPVIFPNQWETVFYDELAKDNVANVLLKNYWYPNLESVLIEVSTTFTQSLEGTYYLVVMIAEDHVTAAQKNNNPAIGPTPDWLDFDHRNILRDAISPLYGTPLSVDGSITPNIEYTNSFFYAPDENWETANCKIIAYILHEETGEVVQVAELGIKTSD